MILFNFLIANICASYYKVYSEKEKHISLLKNSMNIKAMRLSSSIKNDEGTTVTVLRVSCQNLGEEEGDSSTQVQIDKMEQN